MVKPPQMGFAVHLLKRYDCLLLIGWAFINLFGYMTVLYSLSNYAVQVGGLTQSQASVLTAILNLGTGVGRPALGVISDHCGRTQTAAVVTLLNAAFIFAFWIPATSYGFLIFYALIAGATVGIYWMVGMLHVFESSRLTEYQTVGPLCAEVAGLAEVPSFPSIQWLTAVLPTTFAEVIALYLRRPAKGRWDYLYTQLFAAIAFLVASLCLFELWRIKANRGELTRSRWHKR